LGTTATSVNFAAGSNGGFAAYGGALTVSTNLGTWGTTANSLTATSNLILGSRIADNVVTLSAALNLGAVARTIQLVDNTNSANDAAAISGTISGTGGGLNLTGAGFLTLSNANSYTGTTTVGSGVHLSISNATGLGTTAGGTTVNSGGYLSLRGNIAVGAEALSLSGTGVGAGNAGALRNISGTNSYGGAITLAAATRVNSDAGTLTLSGTVGGAAQNLTVGGAGNVTMNGIIGTTTGTLTKDGAGTLTLGAANTFTGLTTVSGGSLALSGSGSLAGAVNVDASGAGLNISGITASGTAFTALSGVSGSTLALGNKTLTVGSANSSTTFAGVMSGTSGSLTKTGTGTLTLSAANTYTGTTAINGGTVSVATINNGSVAGGLGQAPNAAANLVLGGGTLRYTGDTASTDRNFTLSAGTSSTIEVTNVASALTMTGTTTATSGGLTKAGAGTLILSGNYPSTGGFTLAAGTLRATTSPGALGAGTLTLSGGDLQLANDTGLNFGRNTTVNGSTTLVSDRLAAGGGVTHTLGTLSLGANTLTIGKGANVTSGTAGVTFGNTTFTGAGTILASAGAQVTFSGTMTGNFTKTFDGAGNTTASGQISGSGGLTKNGAGTLTLASSANSYTGGTTINNGIVSINASASLGSETVTFNGGQLQVTATRSLNNPLVINAATAALLVDSGATLTVNGTVSGSFPLNKTGLGMMILAGSVSPTTPVEVTQGDLQLTGPETTIRSISLPSASSTLDISGLSSPVIETSAITGSAGSIVKLGTRRLELITNLTSTFSGSFEGSAEAVFVKKGTGRFTLDDSSAFAGSKIVEAGALIINGSSNGASSGSLTVQPGGTLGGSGTVRGATTIEGIHSPGNSPGIQTFTTGLTYSGAAVEWELYSNTADAANRGNSTIGWDGVDVTGGNLNFINPTTMSLVFNGNDSPGSSVNWTNALWLSNQKWLVYQVTGGGSILNFNNFSISQQNWLDSGGRSFYDYGGDASNFSLGVEGNSIYLNFTAIPEPSRVLLMMLGLVGVVFNRRRKS
jgi:autotransporter-associated beta strand protein